MSDGSQVRTRDEIEDLKRQWASDPAWDLQFTEGFEAHRAELAAFDAEMAASWHAASVAEAAAEAARLDDRARRMGCTREVVLHIEGLEDRVRELGEEIERLRGRPH